MCKYRSMRTPPALFQSNISLVYNGKTHNMKSILGFMSLVSHGASVTLRVEVSNENEAMAKVDEMMNSERLAE
ncbi:phosphotransferase system HPr (HPr) family [Edaphobacillus lindanitolerans]|uniref:Phosphotransferase system HPr (HPr) family n=1 Tax=Edaphobacillus lindanitolerans TaxID=550447 RepID=A0A1U7PNQ3_9BACI|nr:phosphotransferase system HPr (HPr) family [Edaphobacillus lindanitolerans]